MYCQCGCRTGFHPVFQIKVDNFINKFELLYKYKPTIALGPTCFNDYFKHKLNIRSLHIQGKAVDFKFDNDKELSNLLSVSYSLDFPGKGIDFKRGILHLDMGNKEFLKLMEGDEWLMS